VGVPIFAYRDRREFLVTTRRGGTIGRYGSRRAAEAAYVRSTGLPPPPLVWVTRPSTRSG
jgi:hypothetical protein